MPRKFSLRRFRRLFRAMERDLGPLVWHDHANGYANCRACVIGHPFAPHFDGCLCGHCPNRATAMAAVTQDLALKGQQA